MAVDPQFIDRLLELSDGSNYSDIRELQEELTQWAIDLQQQPAEPAAHPLSYSEAERIGYRMFEHGKTNNTVSAQCEMQALRIKLGWTGAGASYPPTKEPKHGA